MQTLTTAQVHAVEDHRRNGRTDRQIEKIVGLAHGFLSRPWKIDLIDEMDKARAEAWREEWHRRDAAHARSYSRSDRVLRGWRPDGDCVSTRPDTAPLRAVPRLPVTRGST